MTRISNGIKFGIIVIGADSLHPVVHTGWRSLAGYFLNISDMDIALLINSVAELLFGPTRFRQNLRPLRIENKDMGSSGYAIPFNVVCYGRYVVLDRRRRKTAGDYLAVGAQHRDGAILRLEARIIDVELVPGVAFLPGPLGNQRMPARRAAEH